MEKIELVLEGLNCANCASKIERKVNELKEVHDATMNFANKILIINLNDGENKDKAFKEAKDIVNALEPHVVVIDRHHEEGHIMEHEHHNHEHHHDHHHHHHEHGEGNKGNIKLIIGLVLFATTFIFKENTFTKLIIYLVIYLLVGGEVLLSAFNNILNGEVFDENFLMAIATIGAISIKQYPEAVAVMLFYQIGETFQDFAVNRSRNSISALMKIKPEFANLQIEGSIKKVNPKEVKIGDIILVKPGEKVPLDGLVIEGESFLDTSVLTGESVNRKIKTGDEILSGFINKTSLIKVKVTKTFKDSSVSKILELVENANAKKAPIENFITKFARYYTPIVVISAVLLALVPPAIMPHAKFDEWLYRALIFLVVSCPCALVVSIPLGFFGGIGAASKNGILVKGSNYLQALSSVESIVFDKTGTLTEGVFKVSNIVAQNGLNKEQLLELAAKGESFSNHPIALSIMNCYGKEIDKTNIKDYEEISGKGIKALVDGKQLILGNDKLMDIEKIPYENINTIGTVIHVALDKIYVGYIVIADKLKKDTKDCILNLKTMGVKNTIMLTGDNKSVADKVAEEIKIDKVYSELLPQDKVKKVEEIFNSKSKNGKVVFVGDGVNDAPVLARADIGIAMGALGSDAAIEAADIVLMTDEPSKIINAIKISKKTNSIVWQNIIFALGVKFVVLVLGALGLANMWAAVFSDVGVALLAVLNSMRTLRYKA